MQEVLAITMVVLVLAFADSVADAASPGKQCRIGSAVHFLKGC